MSFKTGSSKTKQNSTENQNPWEPSIPYLKTFLGQVGSAGQDVGTTQKQNAAIANLEANSGNPWASQIGATADKAFATTSRAPMVTDAYTQLQKNLGDYASGKNLDFSANPYIQSMLQTIGDDTQNRINAQFAAAGRDLSGANSQAVARGLAQGEAPVLAGLFTDAQGKQIDAANSLYGAGNTTAQSAQGLDKDALGANAAGVDLARAAVDAKNQGDTATLDLEQLKKSIPLETLSQLGPLLSQIAGLGGDKKGTAITKGSSSGFSLSMSDIGKAIAALG